MFEKLNSDSTLKDFLDEAQKEKKELNESKNQIISSSNPSSFRFNDKTGLDFDKIEVGWGGMKLDDIKIAI